MKRLFLLLSFSLTLALTLNQSGNANNDPTVSVLPAPVSSVQQTNINPPVSAYYNSRFFGEAVATTSNIVRSFLNTPGTLVNVGSSTTRFLFGGSLDGSGQWFGLEYIAAGSGNLVRIDTTTGVITTVGPLTNLATGHTVTGMSWDRTTSKMYVVSTNGTVGTLYTANLTNGTLTVVAATMAGTTLPIDIAINSAGIMYSSDIGADVLNTIDKNTGAATLVGPLGINLNFAQGMCIDPSTDSLFLAAYLATNTSGIYRCNTSTGSTTLIGGLGAAGNTELDAFIIPGGVPTPPSGDTVLVLIHDTLATTTQRTNDKDTLYRYLPQLVRNYKVVQFDTNTTLPTLTNYKTIILQETSFDAAGKRYLGVNARGQIKTWLASGTAGNKKSLISIGADQAYNYSRSGSGAQDITFAETYGKYIYRLDNAPGTTSPSITGVAIDIGNTRNLTSSPPGGSFWPDGCSMVAGGSSALYKYQNHTATDTLAAIGNVQPGFVIATTFQDPRYFTGGFRDVLASIIGWVVTNGGVITNVNTNTISTIPDEYSLSQNYPNPFNPTTKINYTIPRSGLVSIKVYDILGRLTGTLVNEFKNAGTFQVTFDGSNYSSGTYFYRIETDGFVQTKKMSLLK